MTARAAGQAALADILARLTTDQAGIEQALQSAGYAPQPIDAGLLCPGSPDAPVLIAPLPPASRLARDGDVLTGAHAPHLAVLAALISAVTGVSPRPSLALLSRPATLPADWTGRPAWSLEGGVVPHVWPDCFGSFDMMIRVSGNPAEAGRPNQGSNAIEAAFPILSALMALKTALAGAGRPDDLADSPLAPRLSIMAAHGGRAPAELPVLFDITVSRRYPPAENAERAMADLRHAVLGAAAPGVRVAIALGDHRPPRPDPAEDRRRSELAALAAGWGWPQVPFCNRPRLVPDAWLFGGLERPGQDPAGEGATILLDDIQAHAASIRALLSAPSPGAPSLSTP